MSCSELTDIDDLIERSSLGDESARLLRARTSPEIAEHILFLARRSGRTSTYETPQRGDHNLNASPKEPTMTSRPQRPGENPQHPGKYRPIDPFHRPPLPNQPDEVNMPPGHKPLPPTPRPGEQWVPVKRK